MTLLNVRAKNHPQQVGRRGADDATDDRRTPDELWAHWHTRFRFTLDVAASAENAKLPKYYDIAADAFRQKWTGERVWCNPPYSNVGEWVQQAWIQMLNGCSLVVMLLPANRTEQQWWQRDVEPYRERSTPRIARPGVVLRVEFLPGRIRFKRPGWTKPAKGDRPPFGLCLLVWSRCDETREWLRREREVCAAYNSRAAPAGSRRAGSAASSEQRDAGKSLPHPGEPMSGNELVPPRTVPGKITGSCGHEIGPYWFDDPRSNTITKSRTRDGRKSLCYATDCEACRWSWERAGILFKTEDEAKAWMREPWQDGPDGDGELVR